MVFSKTDDFESLAQPLEDIARKFKSKVFSNIKSLSKSQMDLVNPLSLVFMFMLIPCSLC